MLIGLIPIFNEEKTIIEVLQKLEKQADFIVLVNDGSYDMTGLLIENWMKEKNNIYCISYKQNKGMAYALLQGLKFIMDEYKNGLFNQNDAIVTLDADGQHNPEDIKDMYRYFMDKRLDLLIGKRNFYYYPRLRVLGNKLLSLFVSRLVNFKFHDIQSGFKIIKLNLVFDLSSFYMGSGYVLSGQTAIIARLCGYNIDNDFAVNSPYYRKGGPNILDFLIDLIVYSLVFLRITASNYKKLLDLKYA